jgi:predicted permease
MSRRRSDADFAREIDAHLALETDRLIAEGMGPDAARALAIGRFGNPAAVAERFYESRRIAWVDHARQDLVHAWRSLARTPGFTVIAVLTLAFGVAATTLVATPIKAVFLQDVAVTDTATLRALSWTSPRRGFANGLFRGPRWDARLAAGEHIDSFPFAAYQTIEAEASAFEDVACWRPATEALTPSGLVRVQAATGTYFQTLRVTPLRGRLFDDRDDRPGSPLVALAADPALLDQTIVIHGHAFAVVGILPRGFTGLDPMSPADLIVPYSADALFPTFQRNDWSQCHIVGRLAPGGSWEQSRAQAEVVVHQAILSQPPATDASEPPRLHLDELSVRFSNLRRATARPLGVLVATVGLLLLITCANLGGLLFARGRARHKEIATRVAVGASRSRLVRQLLTESLLLSALGGVAGIAGALASTPLLPWLVSELGGAPASGLSLSIDLPVLAFSMAVSATCGLVFGIWPALTATRIDPAAALKHAAGVSPPVRARAGKTAVALQLALSMVVIVGAGLLIRTVANLYAVPLGYQPEGLVFAETNNPVGRPRAVVEETLADLRALPGVSVASVSQWPLFNNTTLRFPFCIGGAEPAVQQLDLAYAFPQFFETWGVRLTQGRDLDDGAAAGVIVNETFVQRFLKGQTPLGTTIGLGGCPGRTQAPIIGVVADHIDRQRVERVPAVYLRYPRAGALYVTTYAVRTAGDERVLLPDVRRVIAAHGIAPTGDVRTGVEYRDSMTRLERLIARLLVVFGALVFFISCLGVYGLLSYTVSWRVPEIALRIAVGAERRDVVRLIVGESMLPVVFGVAAGAIGAAIVMRSIDTLLFGVSTFDAATLLVSAAVLTVGASLASWVPARRASTIDPAPALRSE